MPKTPIKMHIAPIAWWAVILPAASFAFPLFPGDVHSLHKRVDLKRVATAFATILNRVVSPSLETSSKEIVSSLPLVKSQIKSLSSTAGMKDLASLHRASLPYTAPHPTHSRLLYRALASSKVGAIESSNNLKTALAAKELSAQHSYTYQTGNFWHASTSQIDKSNYFGYKPFISKSLQMIFPKGSTVATRPANIPLILENAPVAVDSLALVPQRTLPNIMPPGDFGIKRLASLVSKEAQIPHLPVIKTGFKADAISNGLQMATVATRPANIPLMLENAPVAVGSLALVPQRTLPNIMPPGDFGIKRLASLVSKEAQIPQLPVIKTGIKADAISDKTGIKADAIGGAWPRTNGKMINDKIAVGTFPKSSPRGITSQTPLTESPASQKPLAFSHPIKSTLDPKKVSGGISDSPKLSAHSQTTGEGKDKEKNLFSLFDVGKLIHGNHIDKSIALNPKLSDTFSDTFSKQAPKPNTNFELKIVEPVAPPESKRLLEPRPKAVDPVVKPVFQFEPDLTVHPSASMKHVLLGAALGGAALAVPVGLSNM